MAIRIPPKTDQDAKDTTAAVKNAASNPVTQGVAVADSVAADTPALVTDFNNLLGVLRDAGIIATE